MTKQIGIIVWGCLGAVSLLASEPVLVFEIRLSSIAPAEAQTSAGRAYMVKALAWAPDGKSIAAIVGPEGTGNDDLLATRVPQTAAGAKRITLAGSLHLLNRLQPLHWCPASDCIAVDFPRQYEPRAGVFWMEGNRQPVIHTGEVAGFVDARRMLLTSKGAIPDFATAKEATIEDVEGGPATVPSFFTADVDYMVGFGPPPRALVHRYGQETVVLDPLTGTILSRGLALSGHTPETHFGDRGRLVCVASDVEAARSNPVLCYDTSTGSEILPRPKVRNGTPFDVARDAPVLLASDIFEPLTLLSFFSENGSPWIFKSLVLWDLAKGQEIAHLKYPMQTLGSAKMVRSANRIGRSAIAPDGRRFAVGADDFLRIYEVPKR